MHDYFSHRFKDEIDNPEFAHLFSSRLRSSIIRILEKHSVTETPEINVTFRGAEQELGTFYTAQGTTKEIASLPLFIRNGSSAEVIDAIEAWFEQRPPSVKICEREMNDVIMIHIVPWRFVNGIAVKVDG